VTHRLIAQATCFPSAPPYSAEHNNVRILAILRRCFVTPALEGRYLETQGSKAAVLTLLRNNPDVLQADSSKMRPPEARAEQKWNGAPANLRDNFHGYDMLPTFFAKVRQFALRQRIA